MSKTFLGTKSVVAAFALAAAALSATAPARADLTISGPVGLPLNPTARMPLPGGWRLQANYFDIGKESGTAVDPNTGDSFKYSGSIKNYGIFAAGAVNDRVEISGGLNKVNGRGNFSGYDASGFALGAKYLISKPADATHPRIAIGAVYDKALIKKASIYLVGTSYLGNDNGNSDRMPIAAHLGIRYDRYKDILGNSSKVSVYGGVEVPITADNSWSVVGELQTPNVKKGKFPYAASIRFQPRNTAFSASVGIARQGWMDKNGLFAQVGYSFDRTGDE